MGRVQAEQWWRKPREKPLFHQVPRRNAGIFSAAEQRNQVFALGFNSLKGASVVRCGKTERVEGLGRGGSKDGERSAEVGTGFKLICGNSHVRKRPGAGKAAAHLHTHGREVVCMEKLLDTP